MDPSLELVRGGEGARERDREGNNQNCNSDFARVPAVASMRCTNGRTRILAGPASSRINRNPPKTHKGDKELKLQNSETSSTLRPPQRLNTSAQSPLNPLNPEPRQQKSSESTKPVECTLNPKPCQQETTKPVDWCKAGHCGIDLAAQRRGL